MNKIKEFFKKKVVRIISIILIIALVAFIAVTVIRKKTASTSVSTQDFTYVRTVTLGYGSLEETIVADGTIESQTTSTISSSVNGAKISKINYSVGDYVKAGDVIVELDTTSLNKQITKTSNQISDQEDALYDSYSDAYDNLDSAGITYNSAKSAYDTAETAKKTADTKLKDYNDAVTTAQNNLNKFVQDKLTEGYTADQIKTDTTIVDDDGHNYDYYNGLLTTKQNNLKAMQDALGYSTILSTYNDASTALSKAKSTLNQAEDAYDTAYDKYTDGVDTDTLDELKDTASDYKLKAQTDGQITSINAVVGDNASGTIATIQDTSKLKISLTIDEYDILKLELGMKAKIQTDASDTVYEGVVSMISPTASSSMGSSGFEIEVNVTSEDVSDLLIGMNAEVTIILSSTDENFTVPIDAVETKADGTKVIYVQNDNGDFEELEVTTGEENGYYIEVFSDELKTGMVVRASADAEEAEVTVSEDDISSDSNLFGDFGGMTGGGSMPSGGGGNMPSGGGGMPSGGGRNGN